MAEFGIPPSVEILQNVDYYLSPNVCTPRGLMNHPFLVVSKLSLVATRYPCVQVSVHLFSDVTVKIERKMTVIQNDRLLLDSGWSDSSHGWCGLRSWCDQAPDGLP